MNEEPEDIDIPWIPVGILLALYILGALMEYFNWTPLL